MRGDFIILVLAAFVLAVSVPVLTPPMNYYRMTGHFFPIKKIETLQHPVAVTGWSSNALRLVDGRIVQVPGFRSLPIESDALTEATKRGVEVEADGRVLGLVRIHHWCGNDPVREHIARVDLAGMMTFFASGRTRRFRSKVRVIDYRTGRLFLRVGMAHWRVLPISIMAQR